MHVLLRGYKDTNDFVKSILKRNPKKVILQKGTKNIKKDKPKQVKQKLVKLVDEMKQEYHGLQIKILCNMTHPSTPK